MRKVKHKTYEKDSRNGKKFLWENDRDSGDRTYELCSVDNDGKKSLYLLRISWGGCSGIMLSDKNTIFYKL